MVKRREDDRGENDKGGRTRSVPNPRERQRRRRGRSKGSGDRVTELRNTITWRKEDIDRGGRQPGGRGGQQKRGLKPRRKIKRRTSDHDVVGSLRNIKMTRESLKCMTAAVEDMKVGDPVRDSRAGLRNEGELEEFAV
jgi:hypothetical protein